MNVDFETRNTNYSLDVIHPVYTRDGRSQVKTKENANFILLSEWIEPKYVEPCHMSQ